VLFESLGAVSYSPSVAAKLGTLPGFQRLSPWPFSRSLGWNFQFSMTLNDPYPYFQDHAIIDAEYLINGTTYRHSFNEILIRTYTCPTQQCHFEWPWVTYQNIQRHEASRGLSATAELLVTRDSIAAARGRLKMREWKMRHGHNCRGGKCRSKPHG